MKTRTLLAVILLCAGLTVQAAQKKDEKDADLTGNWATEATRTAIPDEKTGGFGEQILKKSTDIAGDRIPTGSGRGGGRMGPMGPRAGAGVTIDPTGAKVVAKGSSPDGIALTMELKLNKSKNKTTLTGTVTEVVSGAKADIEEGKIIDGQKFVFATYKKVTNIKMGTLYKGELVSPKIIHLTRWSMNEKALDLQSDGTPEVLVFTRAK